MQGAGGSAPASSSKMQVSCPKCNESMVFTVEIGVEMVRLECTKCRTVIDAVTRASPVPIPAASSTGTSKKNSIDLTSGPSGGGGAKSDGAQNKSRGQVKQKADLNSAASQLDQLRIQQLQQQHNQQLQQQRQQQQVSRLMTCLQ